MRDSKIREYVEFRHRISNLHSFESRWLQNRLPSRSMFGVVLTIRFPGLLFSTLPVFLHVFAYVSIECITRNMYSDSNFDVFVECSLRGDNYMFVRKVSLRANCAMLLCPANSRYLSRSVKSFSRLSFEWDHSRPLTTAYCFLAPNPNQLAAAPYSK